MTLVLPCVVSTGLIEQRAEVPDIARQPAASILVVEENEEAGAFAETLLSELGHLTGPA